MTYTDSELYPSFEDFMREDKLPPVFPSSQSSVVSETQVYSQHLISEVCDLETYGPFGINGINDDDLPPNFINSSLAYSPKSIPPHSPSIDSSPLNMTSAGSSTLDPLDIATGDADDMLEDLGVESTFNELSEEDVNVAVGNAIWLDNRELMQFLDNAYEIPEKDDLTSFTYEEVLPTPSISPLPTSTSLPNPVVLETPTVSHVNSELSSSDSNNQLNEESISPVIKPTGTRGRKRKLFSNCEEKKKDQNKEAARRYREKKKNEDARLEAEEAAEIERQKELRRELESLTRTHKEFLLCFKECLMAKRQ